jgi:WD40 repeat protein
VDASDQINQIAFRPDGKILTCSDRGNISLWDAQGRIIKRLEGVATSAQSINVSTDGKYFAVGTLASGAGIWSTTTHKLTAVLEANGEVVKIDFIPPEHFHTLTLDSLVKKDTVIFVISGIYEGEINVWSVDPTKFPENYFQDMESLFSFNCFNSVINSAVFLKNGDAILTGSNDGAARAWLLKPKYGKDYKIPLRDFLKNNMIDELTEEQKEQYNIKD